MSNLKTQFGTAVTADFDQLTWTFEMSDDYKVPAGEFAILPREKYELLLNACIEAKKYHQGGRSAIGFQLAEAICAVF